MPVKQCSKIWLLGLLGGCALVMASVPTFASTQSTQVDPAATKKSTTTQNPASTMTFKLKNGLQVIVEKDARAPIVVSQIWYRIGSSFELTGTTGVSHVLEHMMFKETEIFKTGQVSKLVAKYGGSENAFTGQDYTGYYQLWEKSRLPISLAIEAERMQNLKLDPKEFAKEVKVVMEERRLRTDDQPLGTAYERFNAAAYVSSPYQAPIIGWMHDLERLTLKKTKQWYKQWYMPNNATLVVVGDVEFAEVKALAEKYFGPIESKVLPQLPDYHEVPPKGIKRIVVENNVKVPTLFMGWLVPSMKTATNPAEPYALNLLTQVLDGGLSARFETELVRRKKLASSIGTNYSAVSRGDTQFFIQATPADGVSLDTLEQAILDIIDDVKQDVPSAKEMERIIAQLSAAEIFAKDSVSAKAQSIGRLAVVGIDWRKAYEGVEAYDEITPEEVQKVAQKYLKPKRLTVLNLVPFTRTTSTHTTSKDTKPTADDHESTGAEQ